MPRRLPPLNAVKAFEAAARSRSFTRAAEELFVTPGAVSQQVKALETDLGLKLFNRERQRLVITEAGREYLAVVRDALDQTAAGTARLVQRQQSGVLTVSVSPDFAAKWLVNRLGRFAETHRAIDLRLFGNRQSRRLCARDVDLAVRHGDGNWPGLNVTRLCSERLFPVCSPKADRRPRPRHSVRLAKAPLLRLVDGTGWTRWFEAAGVAHPAAHGPVLNREHVDRCSRRWSGRGAFSHNPCGLGSHQWASRHPYRRVVGELEIPNTYWIVCPKATATTPKIYVPAMAARGSGRGCAPIGNSHRLGKAC
jgi:LysR family glycine cleavage system transcriptional activator